MKLIIAGSRGINEIKHVYEAYKQSGYGIIKEIVSGHAHGVDKLGEKFAVQNGIKVKLFPANWREYGKAAGHIRNREMGEYGDALLAVWDGKSKGTRGMIRIMKELGKPYYVYEI